MSLPWAAHLQQMRCNIGMKVALCYGDNGFALPDGCKGRPHAGSHGGFGSARKRSRWQAAARCTLDLSCRDLQAQIQSLVRWMHKPMMAPLSWLACANVHQKQATATCCGLQQPLTDNLCRTHLQWLLQTQAGLPAGCSYARQAM